MKTKIKGRILGILAGICLLPLLPAAYTRAAGQESDISGLLSGWTQEKNGNPGAAESWADVYGILKNGAENREEAVTIDSAGELNLSEDYRILNQIIYCAGIQDFEWSFEPGQVTLTDIVYADEFLICSGREELLDYLWGCGEQGITDFMVYFTPDWKDGLFAEDRRELNRLLAESCLIYPSSFSYNEEYGRICFENAAFYQSQDGRAGKADSRQEFLEAFFRHTAGMENSFEIYVLPEVLKEIQQERTVGSNTTSLLSEIRSNSGIVSWTQYVVSGQFIGFRDVAYYEGKRILEAYRKGETDRLGQREQDTLREALAMAGAASGTALEKEKAVHDALCARIEYVTEGSGAPHGDNDCAVGALLNGRADCDGYADAFYLCANLAGVPADYQHGDALSHGEAGGAGQTDRSDADGSHMWNLVCIDGSWVMTDVTWDDSDEGISYVNYNMGREQAAARYAWDEDAAAHTVVSAAGNEFRNEELAQTAVASWEELYAAVRSGAEAEAERISLRYSPDLGVAEDTSRLSALIYSVGIDSFQWEIKKDSADIFGMEYAEEFRICDTEEEALAYVEECALAQKTEFRLYFPPSLSALLFAGEREELNRLLACTRLKNPWKYSYSDAGGRVTIQEASYYLPEETGGHTEVTSWQEVFECIGRNVQEKKTRFVLFSGGEPDLYGESDRLAGMMYQSGVKSFGWRFFGGVADLSEVEYYEHFRICHTEEEIASYLTECRDQELDSFRVYVAGEELYKSLQQDNASGFFALLDEAGIRGCQLYSNDSNRMFLTEMQ